MALCKYVRKSLAQCFCTFSQVVYYILTYIFCHFQQGNQSSAYLLYLLSSQESPTPRIVHDTWQFQFNMKKMAFTVRTFWICTRYWRGLKMAGSAGFTPNTYGESSMFLGFVSFSISNSHASKNSPAPSRSQQHKFFTEMPLVLQSLLNPVHICGTTPH